MSLCAPGCGASTSREEKAVLLLERMADAFEKYGDTDCEALATDLDRAIAKDGDALAALADSDRDDSARRKISKFQRRIDDATLRIVGHAKKCGSDPRVSRALAAVLGDG
jgi:hypothetical protein